MLHSIVSWWVAVFSQWCCAYPQTARRHRGLGLGVCIVACVLVWHGVGWTQQRALSPGDFRVRWHTAQVSAESPHPGAIDDLHRRFINRGVQRNGRLPSRRLAQGPALPARRRSAPSSPRGRGLTCLHQRTSPTCKGRRKRVPSPASPVSSCAISSSRLSLRQSSSGDAAARSGEARRQAGPH